MPTTLYFSRNPNPRLGLAVARYLNAPVDLVHAQYSNPAQRDMLLALNPNGLLPILAEGQAGLWETDAIACRLSQMVGSEFWRTGADQPEMIRWISWAHKHFGAACDLVNWERGTKPRYGIGPTDEAEVTRGLADFAQSGAILNAQLANRPYLLGATPSYADFRMAAFLPYLSENRLPIDDFPAVAAWNGRLMSLPAWADPFDGLGVPDLPPLP